MAVLLLGQSTPIPEADDRTGTLLPVQIQPVVPSTLDTVPIVRAALVRGRWQEVQKWVQNGAYRYLHAASLTGEEPQRDEQGRYLIAEQDSRASALVLIGEDRIGAWWVDLGEEQAVVSMEPGAVTVRVRTTSGAAVEHAPLLIAHHLRDKFYRRDTAHTDARGHADFYIGEVTPSKRERWSVGFGDELRGSLLPRGWLPAEGRVELTLPPSMSLRVRLPELSDFDRESIEVRLAPDLEKPHQVLTAHAILEDDHLLIPFVAPASRIVGKVYIPSANFPLLFEWEGVGMPNQIAEAVTDFRDHARLIVRLVQPNGQPDPGRRLTLFRSYGGSSDRAVAVTDDNGTAIFRVHPRSKHDEQALILDWEGTRLLYRKLEERPQGGDVIHLGDVPRPEL